MLQKYDWLKTSLKMGKVILIKSGFEVPVEKVLQTLISCDDSDELLTVLSILPLSTCMKGIIYRQISIDEEIEILSLYLTYDFSDCFRVLSRRQCCGSFLNLVDAGYMSMDEALRVWLHR